MKFHVVTPKYKSAEFEISWVQIDHCYHAFEYYWRSLSNTKEKALRVEYALKLYDTLERWLNTPKFYTKFNHGNEYLVKVKLDYRLAILLFEVAEYANRPMHLFDLMCRIQSHLLEYFNIRIESTKVHGNDSITGISTF